MTPTVPVIFFYKERHYKSGSIGVKTEWKRYVCRIDNIDLDVFWVDWHGSYGSQQIQAMSQSVYDLCTVRMDYHPGIYQLLRTREVIIIKNAASDAIGKDGTPVLTNPDVYTLWGAADNIHEERRLMEFKVRRFEAK